MNGLGSSTQESQRVGQTTSPRSTRWNCPPTSPRRAVPTARRAHPRVDALLAGVPTEADSEQVAGRDRRVPVPNRAELDAARQRALELQGGADPRSAPPPSQHRKRIACDDGK